MARQRRLSEEDRAAQALGVAIEVGQAKPTPLEYDVKCPFCHKNHISRYWDEIEEGIMACRELAPDWRRGKLDPAVNYEGGTTLPLEWLHEWGT